MDNSGIIREVGGRKYQFYKLPVKKALRILIRIAKILGVSIGKGFAGYDTSKNIADQEINVGEMVGGLLGRLEENEVIDLIEEILQHIFVQANGTDFKKIDLEIDFDDRLGDLFGVISEALKINYTDFFGAAFGLVKRSEATPKKKK